MFPEKADFTIIGNGIVGCSIAFNLAKLGAKNIVVMGKYLEKTAENNEAPENSGLVNCFSENPLDVIFASAAIKVFSNWQDEFPAAIKYDIGFRKQDKLFIAHSPTEYQEFTIQSLRQQKLGFNDFVFLDSRSIKERFPDTDLNGVIAGVYYPCTEASINSANVRMEYRHQSELLGVQFFENIEIIDIGANLNLATTKKRSVEIIFTDQGPILTKCVIVAEDGETEKIGRMLNIEIPIGQNGSTPDNFPILGKTEKADGLILSSGFRKNDISYGPIMGKIIAETAFFGDNSMVDISCLRLDNFENNTRPQVKKHFWKNKN